MRVSLLTGGDDPNYAIPLATSLADQGIEVEFIGNDDMQGFPSLKRENIKYLNLRGSQDPQASAYSKTARVLRYYQNLISYTLRTESRLFHILWLNKFDLLDRTIMNLFYKSNRKKLVFTAHNVNMLKRDGNDTWTNKTTLRVMYSILDHIFVHTDLSKDELVAEYRVVPSKVSVIPFGLNTYVPDTYLSKAEARARLGLGESEKVLLFFGQIAPYKGLDMLLEAMKILFSQQQKYCLMIAGRVKSGSEPYWQTLRPYLENDEVRSRILVNDKFIPDNDVPMFFRAADALILPYRAIYQSGPLSLAYRFGVPVLATRVGSFDRDVIPGITGLLSQPDSPRDLARVIEQYFGSELYLDGDQVRKRIRDIGSERYSWDRISQAIAQVYATL
jgi:glycosyltransferase involved in cell wall biosynthesis